MRTALRHAAWSAAALAVLVLALSMAGCDSTVASTSSGPITITSRTTVVTVAPGTSNGATASCQTGEVMLSGGYSAPDADAPLDGPPILYVVYEDFPDSTTSWKASVLNRATTSIGLHVKVVCAAGLGETPMINSSGGSSHATNFCSEGYLTGGGYQITPPPTTNEVWEINDSSGQTLGSGGVATSSWTVDAHLAPGSSPAPASSQVHAFSVCVSRQTVEESSRQVTITVPPSTITGQLRSSGSGGASCGPSQILTGAGFIETPEGDSLPVTEFDPAYDVDSSAWLMSLYAFPGPNGQIAGGSAKLIPICMPFS